MAVVKNNIKKFRKELGMSQEALASKANTRRETIYRIENGIFDPTLYLGMKISEALGKAVEEVFEIQE